MFKMNDALQFVRCLERSRYSDEERDRGIVTKKDIDTEQLFLRICKEMFFYTF